MSALQVRLFGRISIQREGRPLPGLSTKALELLSYLLLHRDRAHPRESLAGLLWPDVPDTLSRKYLRQTLWQLRVALYGQAGGDHVSGGNPDGDDVNGGHTNGGRAQTEPLLVLNLGWVRANPRAALWLDVADLEQAHAAFRDVPGEDLTDLQARVLEEAAGHYRGDLAESWYQDWCVFERDRLQQVYLAMLEKLASHCTARHLHTRGVAYGHRILRYDPARESAHRLLMRLHFDAGNRTAALRQYDRCAAVVAEEFGLPPSQQTVALYEQVRAGHLEQPPPRPAGGLLPSGEPDGDTLVALHRRLDHIRARLSSFHDQVQQELTAISRVLSVGRQDAPADAARGDLRALMDRTPP